MPNRSASSNVSTKPNSRGKIWRRFFVCRMDSIPHISPDSMCYFQKTIPKGEEMWAHYLDLLKIQVLIMNQSWMNKLALLMLRNKPGWKTKILQGLRKPKERKNLRKLPNQNRKVMSSRAKSDENV
ncbi:hypothetical protein BLNAU_19286 [Blattamonas nauphoetae]|uniref:Uncharacterized protein n=1 Tax=Blattamonas nauphoetae TaxID=2049346 RepID=A0ABQ9X2H7_9EUKA|nr:hypothetical protein BLNAU_19286 [Blattamonas nauphoetae]